MSNRCTADKEPFLIAESRDFDLDGRVAAWEHRNGVSILRNDLTIDVASRVSQIADPANAALQAA